MPECGQDLASGRWKNLNNLLLAKTMPPPLQCCCSVTCPLQHKAAIHSPCRINILWQRIDNNFFHFRELWNIIQVQIHNFVATHPNLWKFISSTVCVKRKAPNHMHAAALLYKDMMSTPSIPTPAVSVYLLDHLHVSLKQNPFYKKSRRGFCH